MSCTRPLVRIELKDAYRKKKNGDLTPQVIFIDRRKYEPEKEKYEKNSSISKIQLIGCGSCFECKMQNARNTATKVMLHKMKFPEEKCWFITLTYNDEHLPFHETVNTKTGEIITGASISLEDEQKFWKRVRKHWPDEKIQYITALEYGKKTHRPHMHAIVFGLPLNYNNFKKIGMNKMNDPLFTDKELEKLWGKGNVQIGRVTWRSAGYVARYTVKKIFGFNDDWYREQGKLPEKICWSNGIGKKFFTENWKQIYETDTVPIKNSKTGQLVQPPKSFDRMLKELDPELWEKVSEKRKNIAETNQAIIMQKTDKNVEEYRKQKEELNKQKFKDMRGDM